MACRLAARAYSLLFDTKHISLHPATVQIETASISTAVLQQNAGLMKPYVDPVVLDVRDLK